MNNADPIETDVLDDFEADAEADPTSDDVAKMDEHNLRMELRRLRDRLDARALERDTFIRHIARQREPETDIEDRLRQPLRSAQTRITELEVRIAKYRETITTLQRERAHFKLRYDSLVRSRKET
jgi:hypothetical protein